ncbi:MAG: AAA family ATPase [Gammaproteobacteria bacterium]|nr:AAA family ATPase [Gammaproteobacteria bacterium]
MLKRIQSIRNLGLVFKNFSWDESAPNFKKINVVYGWNGSGKTTLARFFDMLCGDSDSGTLYDIEDHEGHEINQTALFPYQIRVFNEDYVNKNIDILESRTRSISVFLGEENTSILKQIVKLEEFLVGRTDAPQAVGEAKKLDEVNRQLLQLNKENDNEFTNIARTISAALSQSNTATRNYKRPQAKADFQNLVDQRILSDCELVDKERELNQEVRNKIDLPFEEDRTIADLFNWLSELRDESVALASQTTSSRTISRLVEEPRIGEWVEDGIKLHKEYNSAKCEYCGETISALRIEMLAKHFNDEDRRLKIEIDRVIDDIDKWSNFINNYAISDPNSLYTELYEAASQIEPRLKIAKDDLLSQLEEFKSFLQRKRQTTSEKMSSELEVGYEDFFQVIKESRSLIDEHNEKTENFHKVKERAMEAVKTHFLCSIREVVDERQTTIHELEQDKITLERCIEASERELKMLRASISSDHKAALDLTENLQNFLGREELQFSVNDSKGMETEGNIGYSLLRNGQPAQSLSSGEKTAIAFVYFLVHLEDGHFDKSNGIVVIDDPVSSLDNSSMYQAFAFLKNSIAGCLQSFIFTHNFEFLRLLINWIKNFESKASLFMIKNEIHGNERRALLEGLDPTLIKFETEYQFLFKCFKDLQSTQNNTVQMAYPVPNVARKLWESFLNYHIPNSMTMYRKNELLKGRGFDSQKLDSIYKFTNDQSHITGSGLNPSLVPETLNVIENIFDLMQEIAPEHYKILENAVSAS